MTSRLVVGWTLLSVGLALALRAEPVLTFNQDIRPILSDNCFPCHGTDAKHRKGDRRLDTPEGAYADNDGFRAIVPGDLAASEAWLRITSEDTEEVMPPIDSHKKLTAQQRAVLKRWIEEGGRYQKHWAYEPISKPAPPPSNAISGEEPIDRFIAARLQAHRLGFSKEAAPEVLLRRLTLVLTGLPPTIEELNAYLADTRPQRYERAVDRLLAKPQYGENMARGWLDAVRYADTHGMHLDNVRSLWPYRDWVVRSFNENKPFDRFTIEQLAGDLIPGATSSQLIGTGFLRSHLSTSEAGTIEDEMRAREAADETETTAGVWLGLTANCASCHDHKFDPLAQKEYYQLNAFFQSLDVPVWDGNVPVYGPHVLLANPAQQARLDYIAKELPAREEAISRKAEELIKSIPLLQQKAPAKPATYEVVWAEDADTPRFDTIGQAPPAGKWRDDAPVVAGRRALELEGTVDRAVLFGGGDVPLSVRTAVEVFVHLRPDAAKPPRAVSVEFLAPGKAAKRLVWGNEAAFSPEIMKTAIVVGPLPLAGVYTRISLSAKDAGLEKGDVYTGVRLSQIGGVALWDHLGAICTSPEANKDPLLSSDAWRNEINIKYIVGAPERRTNPAYPDEDPAATFMRQPSPVPLDMRFYARLSPSQQSEAEKEMSRHYFRRYIAGPLRGPLEDETNAARELLAEQVKLENTLDATLVAKERAVPRESFVLLRGQYNQHGATVLPGTPAFLPPLKKSGERASRLDLAKWLVSPEQPLTARVTVNRFWQQIFGTGLVRTPGDFGAQGNPSTHPELLDWLAADFREHGWDVKRLVRQMVLSRTFRQDSKITAPVLEADPGNLYYARGSRYRLDAEVLRDQVLAVSGLMVPTVGGAPVRPYQPEGIWETVAYVGSNTQYYQQDSGSALYRRSLYTMIKRNAPAPAMTTFDAPSRDGFCLRRDRTDTPLQALALMNDVQHLEAARAFAERLLDLPGAEKERLAQGFRRVTARAPDSREQLLLAQALAQQMAHFASHAGEAERVVCLGESKPLRHASSVEIAAWTLVANLLLNLDETVSLN